MSSVEVQIRKIAADLLSEGKVACVIGYETGSTSKRTRPCFIRSPQDASRLVWNQYCTSNLAKYLVGTKDRVAVVAKGCDGRSMVELIKENQLDRDKVVIIAPTCPGVAQTPDPCDGGPERLASYCVRCRSRDSPIFDFRVAPGDTGREAAHASGNEGVSDEVTDWNAEFQRCIRCLACIKSCPLCYCTECELDGSLQSLVSKLRIPAELPTFHLVRAMHMAGRCTECGACEAACPANIPLTQLYSRVNAEVERTLGYVPGLDVRETPPVELPRPQRESK